VPRDDAYEWERREMREAQRFAELDADGRPTRAELTEPPQHPQEKRCGENRLIFAKTGRCGYEACEACADIPYVGPVTPDAGDTPEARARR
jgi:hypothetical protein